jgi:aminoglycoside phosphotransferase (APT) family kinase protein
LERDTYVLLVQLLHEQFGSQVELVDTTVVKRLEDYVVLLATLRHPSLEVVIKLAGPHAPYPYPFDRTALFHRLVATHTTIPMAEVLAVDVSYRAWPWRYFIQTYLPGLEWAAAQSQMNQQELHSAYQQIGEAVAQLHTIPFPHFGEVDPGGTVPSQEDYLSALTKRVYQRIVNPRLVALFLDVVDDHLDLFSGISKATLCHEDLHGYNILFRQAQGRWQLSSILDFDKAWAGHQESDLARLDLWTGMAGEGFWPAYQAICPVADGYVQRRPIYQLFWCLEYAEPSPEHIADTQRVCKQLGIPLLVHFEE